MGDPLKIMAVQWQQKSQTLLLSWAVIHTCCKVKLLIITSLGELATNGIRNTEVQQYKPPPKLIVYSKACGQVNMHIRGFTLLLYYLSEVSFSTQLHSFIRHPDVGFFLFGFLSPCTCKAYSGIRATMWMASWGKAGVGLKNFWLSQF